MGLATDRPDEDGKPSAGDSPPRERRITDAEAGLIVQSLGCREGLPVELPVQRVAVAFLFAIETAMRSGEILGLTSLSFAAGRRGSATDHRPLSWPAVADTAPLGCSHPTPPHHSGHRSGSDRRARVTCQGVGQPWHRLLGQCRCAR